MNARHSNFEYVRQVVKTSYTERKLVYYRLYVWPCICVIYFIIWVMYTKAKCIILDALRSSRLLHVLFFFLIFFSLSNLFVVFVVRFLFLSG